MKKYTILVTSVGGDLGKAICKSLRLSSYPIKIVGTDCKEYLPHLLFCDEFKIIPRADDPGYLKFLNDYVAKQDIQLVYICSEDELFFISDNFRKISPDAVKKLVINPVDVINICKDKYRTVQFLKNNGFLYPNTVEYNPTAALGGVLSGFEFPVVLKKFGGCGSKGVHIVENRQDLRRLMGLNPCGIIQEYLTGDEYTNAVYIDRFTNETHIITLKRKLKDGMTSECSVVFDKEIEDVCIGIAKKLAPTGSINVQLRKQEGKPPVVFEINPRYSSTAYMRAMFGFNDVIFAFENIVLQKPITITHIESGSAYRYLTEYFRFDK